MRPKDHGLHPEEGVRWTPHELGNQTEHRQGARLPRLYPRGDLARIQRGTELRAARGLDRHAPAVKEGWVESRESKAESKGRPVKSDRLPPHRRDRRRDEEEKRVEAEKQRDIMQRLRTITTQPEDLRIPGLTRRQPPPSPTITIVFSVNPAKSPAATTPGIASIATFESRRILDGPMTSR